MPSCASGSRAKIHEFAWRQILEFGMLHTDFHPGNYLVSHHPRLGVLDFGSIRRFPEPVRKANLQVARAILSGDDKSLAAAMVKLGYLDRDQDAAPMVKIIHILFEPMRVDRAVDPLEYDTVGKAAKSRRACAGEPALQISGAQRVPDSRADRAGRNHARTRSEDQLPPNLRGLRRANRRMRADRYARGGIEHRREGGRSS